MKKNILLLYIFLLLVLALIFACNTKDNDQDSEYVYHQPADRSDGWTTSTLAEQGLDTALISDMIARVKNKEFRHVHSVLIVRNGRLILEEYFPGFNLGGEYIKFDWNIRHNLQSATKSFASALVGIAHDQGRIHNIDSPISGFLPEFGDIDWSGTKGDITLKHVLTMSAGYEWDDGSYYNQNSSNTQMSTSSNPIRYLLELPMAHVPGSYFNYNSGLPTLAGRIVADVSGLPADQFAARYLFAPLGISDVYWGKYADGTVIFGAQLDLRPRDMVKFGQLYLDKGTWLGTRIISREWIEASVQKQIWSTDRERFYGYFWWLEKLLWKGTKISCFAARGWGGQRIIVFPDLKMVVVFTGGNFYTNAEPAHTMLQQFILPAVQ